MLIREEPLGSLFGLRTAQIFPIEDDGKLSDMLLDRPTRFRTNHYCYTLNHLHSPYEPCFASRSFFIDQAKGSIHRSNQYSLVAVPLAAGTWLSGSASLWCPQSRIHSSPKHGMPERPTKLVLTHQLCHKQQNHNNIATELLKPFLWKARQLSAGSTETPPKGIAAAML
ncbi:hypothetical protein [Cupriavidus nantongensis]|uniref:hypothetical protein n=1 Tax=Cupriavidus nantongensis TaxID=1796606 RepID=UPI0012372F91|nr:hypothetical protein [Cupriavidus nantongensis]